MFTPHSLYPIERLFFSFPSLSLFFSPFIPPFQDSIILGRVAMKRPTVFN